jgi:tRNA (adenine37-N6)-methyltransferase
MTSYTLHPIGFIQTCFPEKFGIPRQPLLAPSAKGVLVLNAPFNDADCVLGLEGVSHIWLSFIFHAHVDKNWKPKVRPPRLGGNKKVGVFASRSSFRPNQLGLSVVSLDKITRNNGQVCLHLSGVDLLDGTPIIDIKPYVPYADSFPEAINTLAPDIPVLIPVVFSDHSLLFCAAYREKTNVDLRQLVLEVLQQDPRPAYHEDNGERIYGVALLECNVRWQCREGIIQVVDIV